MIKNWILLAISTIYLLNFTAGVFELPDNLPLVGNLDEFAASVLWLHSFNAIRKASKTQETDAPAREQSSSD